MIKVILHSFISLFLLFTLLACGAEQAQEQEAGIHPTTLDFELDSGDQLLFALQVFEKSCLSEYVATSPNPNLDEFFTLNPNCESSCLLLGSIFGIERGSPLRRLYKGGLEALKKAYPFARFDLIDEVCFEPFFGEPVEILVEDLQ